MAIPFNVPRQQSSGDTAAIAHQHYLRIENLLMELLSMLRWTPWATMYEALQNANIQQQANEASAVERRVVQRLQRYRQREQQLPDLVTSNVPVAPVEAALVPDVVAQAQHVVNPASVVAAPAPVVVAEASASVVGASAAAPAPASAAALAPVAAQDQAQPQEIIIVKKTLKNLLLQVQLCPRSLNSAGRMRVFVVKKKVRRSDGNDDNSSDNHHTEAQVVVRQRLMFDIPNCILTAAFVLIGFKIFLKR